MNLLDKLRKGFRFFLMSMGVSTYEKKSQPKEKASDTPAIPPAKPE
ncbi:hypothetical protein [Acidicapsa acidisoli]|nr:hypothetical protein [Acidicapsa acidisoli]